MSQLSYASYATYFSKIMPKNEWEIDDRCFHIFLNHALCFSFGVETTPAQKALNSSSFFPSSPSPQNPSFSSFTEKERARESPKKKNPRTLQYKLINPNRSISSSFFFFSSPVSVLC
eukprot:TRINITY_DN5194_c1_g1_i4.p1 TRINITY_DN5194_c1_g1~~TRINITY_DN5194_c1_g1_i4.p1  ORF type:complete len:117 (-),score=8.39 TRINITY_DN5194_c1_g1_i4:407-757(-)